MCWFIIPHPGCVLFPSLVVHAVPCSRPVSALMLLWLVHERIEANEQVEVEFEITGDF